MAYISKKQREVNSIAKWKEDGKVKSVACVYEHGNNYWQVEFENGTHWGTNLSYEFLLAIGCNDSEYIKRNGTHNELIRLESEKQ